MTTTIQNAIVTIPDGVIGNDAIDTSAEIETVKLEVRNEQIFPISITDARVWDAVQTILPETSSADDLGINTGTFGTNAPSIRTSDLKAAGSTTRYTAFIVPVPQNYKAAGSFEIEVRGGMITTVADTAATVDIQVHRLDRSNGVGADLCQTSATTINSITKATVAFNIGTSTLLAGDLLMVRVAVLVNDAATATAVIAEISDIRIVCDTQG